MHVCFAYEYATDTPTFFVNGAIISSPTSAALGAENTANYNFVLGGDPSLLDSTKLAGGLVIFF